MSYALGIDIGTTTIAAATGHRGDLAPCALGRDSHTAPAAVMPSGYEPPLVGDDAADHLPIESPQLIRHHGPELDLGAPARMLGAPDYDAAEALAAVIDAVVDRAATEQGYLPTRLALTHPFPTSTHRPDTLRQVVSERRPDAVLVPEPIAAAARLSHEAPLAQGALVMVCDLGGTSFSATLVRRSSGGLDVIGEPGVLADFGGVDVDAALAAHVDAALEGAVSALDRHDPAGQAAHRRLWLACRAAKHELSLQDETVLDVDLPDAATRLTVSRAQLEGMIGDRVAVAAEVAAAMIRNAGVRSDDVQVALLVGGASRMAIVADLINRRTGLPTIAEALPDLTVATGAAALADTDPAQLTTPAPTAGVPRAGPAGEPGPTIADGETDDEDIPLPLVAGLRQRIGDRWILAGVVATTLAVLVAVGALLASSQGRDSTVESGPRPGSNSSSTTTTTTTAAASARESPFDGVGSTPEGSAGDGLFSGLDFGADGSDLESAFAELGFTGSGGDSFSFPSGSGLTPGTDAPPPTSSPTTTAPPRTTTTARPTTTTTAPSTTTTTEASTTTTTTKPGGGPPGDSSAPNES